VEDRQCSIGVTFHLVFVHIQEKASNSEFTSLDPELCGFSGRGECHKTAVHSAEEAVGSWGFQPDVQRLSNRWKFEETMSYMWLIVFEIGLVYR